MKQNTQFLICIGVSIGVTALVAWLEIRPYGILAAIGLLIYLYKTLNTRASIKLISSPEFSDKLEIVSIKIKDFRNNHPALFCAISSVSLGVLAIIGHIVSGASVVLCGLILAGLVSTRYNFKIVKVPIKADFTWTEKFDQDITDEFLPEVNEANLFVLERASNHAVVVSSTTSGTLEDDEDKSDDIPSDLLMPDSIPEIDENSDSSEEDLLIKTSTLPISADQNKRGNKISFKKGYFKNDSSISTSSSSEEELSKGLNFDNVDSPRTNIESTLPLQKSQSTPSAAATQAATQAAIQLASQIPGLVTGLVSWGIGSGQIPNKEKSVIENKLESSDDSDFEILDTDEINH